MEERNPFEDRPPQEARTLTAAQTVRAKLQKKTSLDEAFEIVKAHLEENKSFSNQQLDICTEALATLLPPHEREMLKEVATTNNYPLWVGLLAQWRRCVEYCVQYAVLADPDWDRKIDGE